MSKLILLPLIVVLPIQAALAQAKKSTTKNQTSANSNQKKKTVGELLKQADRGAGLQTGSKKSIAIPEVSDLFDQGKNRVNLNQVKPPKSSAFFEDSGDDKARLEKITDQQISELFKLTQKFKNSPQRGELWLRLAELYVEKAGVIDFRKQGEFDQQLKDFQSGKRKTRPVLELSDAKEYNRKAIQLYEWFIRDFPKDEKMDQALFFLGYNHFELNNLDRGTQFYDRLTKEYPSSPYVVETHFALGEYYFENEKWSIARTHYANVLRYKRHRLYTFSLYKTAWCEFRSGDSVKALQTMEGLIRFSKDQAQLERVQGRRNVNKGKLEAEGLRDIVVFYGDIGEPEKAPQYFRNLAGKDANNYLEKLAYLYTDKGNLIGARYLFKYLVQSEPSSIKSFDYKFQVVKLFSNAKRSREFREELFSWVRDFGTQSNWHQVNINNKEFLENSYKLREQTLRTYILQQHQTAQNSRAAFSQALAMEGYKVYLAEFKDSPMLADMHFYYAELLYDLRRFDEAGSQYLWVIQNAKDSKFYSRAFENVLIALEKDLPKDEDIAAKVGKTLEPQPLEPRVAKFVAAATDYVQRIPDAEKAPEIKFRVGRLYYQHNQFDQAIPYFRDIVTKHPKTKYAEYSANLLLDTYNLKKDYAGLEKAGAELLALPGIANSKAGSDIQQVLEKASFKRAQDLEVTKDYAGSANQFEAFAKQNPNSSLAITAIFNAAINYERANLNSQSISAHQAVLRSKGKEADSLKPKSRRIIAKLYQDAGMLEESAEAYRDAAQELGRDSLAPNMYFNAAILFEAIGRNSEAIKNYEAYYGMNKKADRSEALYSIAGLYKRQGGLSKASEYYLSYVQAGSGTAEKNVEAAYNVYEISKKLNRQKMTSEWRAKTLSMHRSYSANRKGVGAQYAAKIKMEDVEFIFNQLRSIKIPANPAAQQEAAQKKIAFVTRLNNELAEIIKLDSPDEIVAALSILGQANLHMGEALVGAPLPAGLNDEETKQYKAGIAKLAEPFFIKAKESLKATVERASELDTFNEYSNRARDLSVKLDVKSFYDGGEIGFESKLVSWGNE
jgi:TolA-binding protein